MISISRVPSSNSELNRVQDQIIPAVNNLLVNTISKNGIIEITLGASAVAVQHRLGREPTGWIVVYSNAGATIYTNGVMDKFSISLLASATVTAKIIFF